MTRWAVRIFKYIIVPLIVLVGGGLLLFLLTSNKKDISIRIDGPLDLVTINRLIGMSDMIVSYNFITKLEIENDNTKKEERASEHLSTTPQRKIPPEELAPGPPTGLFISSAEMSVTTDDAQIYQVSVKNSGTLPLRELPLRLIFTPQEDKKFIIISHEHNTTPKHDFGDIKRDFNEGTQPLFVYSLLNSGDQDIITILTNQKASLKASVKTEGLSYETPDVLNSQRFRLRNLLPYSIRSALCD